MRSILTVICNIHCATVPSQEMHIFASQQIQHQSWEQIMNLLHPYLRAKGKFQDEATSNSEPIAVAVIELCLSEGISE